MEIAKTTDNNVKIKKSSGTLMLSIFWKFIKQFCKKNVSSALFWDAKLLRLSKNFPETKDKKSACRRIWYPDSIAT